MNPTSLAIRTDLIFWRGNGTVVDRGEYLRVETPSNHAFYWGNLLVFEAPPGEGDFERWTGLFEAEFGHVPSVRHMTFGWDVTDGETGTVAPFLAAGFELEANVMLAATAVHPPPKVNADIEVRPIATRDEWAAVLRNQIEAFGATHEPVGYAEYAKRKMEDYRALAEAGVGAWYGAFLGDELAADLGLYFDGTLGRFQAVATREAFRRRGICGTLVHAVSERAFRALGAERLVLAADEAYHAAAIYRSVGFEPVEKSAGVSRRPPGA